MSTLADVSLRMPDHFSAMRPVTKISIVLAAYVVAVVIAVIAVTLNVAATSGPDYQASSGMLAFGDSLLFLAVFGVCEVPATGAALYFLRPYRSLWHVLACVALCIAATGIVTLVGYYLNSGLRLR